jgi:hypothetical protein
MWIAAYFNEAKQVIHMAAVYQWSLCRLERLLLFDHSSDVPVQRCLLRKLNEL